MFAQSVASADCIKGGRAAKLLFGKMRQKPKDAGVQRPDPLQVSPHRI
jgi:hypothetical protein